MTPDGLLAALSPLATGEWEKFAFALTHCWPDIAACLGRLGNLEIDRDEANAYVEVLLVRLAAAEADAAEQREIADEMARTLMTMGHDPTAQGAPLGLQRWAVARRSQP